MLTYVIEFVYEFDIIVVYLSSCSLPNRQLWQNQI